MWAALLIRMARRHDLPGPMTAPVRPAAGSGPPSPWTLSRPIAASPPIAASAGGTADAVPLTSRPAAAGIPAAPAAGSGPQRPLYSESAIDWLLRDTCATPPDTDDTLERYLSTFSSSDEQEFVACVLWLRAQSDTSNRPRALPDKLKQIVTERLDHTISATSSMWAPLLIRMARNSSNSR